MKSSKQKLGLAIQLFMIRNNIKTEDLAQQIGITGDALSNLIHGRRGFKNETLEKLANTPSFITGGMSLTYLRALRAMDEYTLEELIIAMTEYIREGGIENLPPNFSGQLQENLEREGFPPNFASRKKALLSLLQQKP